MKIWYDLDGVICDFEKHFLRWLELPEHSPTDWSDSRFVNNLHRIRWDDLFWISIPKLINAEEITYPIEGYCTARDCHNWVIKKWLKINGFPEASLYNVGFNGNKTKALEGRCDIMVDDSVHNYTELNKSGIKCYLMTRPHNVKESVGEDRVNNIGEFMKKIKENEISRIQ